MGDQAYVEHLDRLISEEQLRASGNPADWAKESFALAKTAWVDGGSVDQQYTASRSRSWTNGWRWLALRLTALLNEVLGHTSPREFRH